MPKFFRGYPFVLSVIYTSLFCASIAVVLTFLYLSSFQFLREQTDQRINEDLDRIIAGSDWPRTGTIDIRKIKTYLDNRRRIHSGSDPSVYLLVDRNGNFIAGNLHLWPPDFPRQTGYRSEFTAQVYGDDSEIKKHTVRAVVESVPGTGFTLLVGRDVMEIEALRTGYLRLFWWSLVATAVLAILGAYWVSRIVSKRLERVNALSRAVMDGDLSQRVNAIASGDQFDDLADNINQMLERIQTLVEAVRSVADNIAHDLRTPLTRLRNHLDEIAGNLAASQNREPDEAREAVAKAISESDSLLRTFDALLRITRLENQTFGETFSDVAVSSLTEELIDLYAPIAESRNISLIADISPATVEIYADRDALAQALANLLDNALQFSPEGGRVTIEGRRVEEGFEMVVTDSGAGIPVEYHEEVLKRFVRLDDSSRTSPGNGLGLSLVAAVARMHKVDLQFENTEPGFKVCLRYFRERCV